MLNLVNIIYYLTYISKTLLPIDIITLLLIINIPPQFINLIQSIQPYLLF